VLTRDRSRSRERDSVRSVRVDGDQSQISREMRRDEGLPRDDPFVRTNVRFLRVITRRDFARRSRSNANANSTRFALNFRISVRPFVRHAEPVLVAYCCSDVSDTLEAAKARINCDFISNIHQRDDRAMLPKRCFQMMMSTGN